MSTYVDEKLEPQRPSLGGRAQARRDQLLARYGSREVSAERSEIHTIGGREVWRRVKGSKDLFEQEVRS